jgi:hypothetical protein
MLSTYDMVTRNASADEVARATERALVDPRAPRFGQAVTATGLLLGVLLGRPALVFAIAAVLVLAVASRWQVDLYGIVFKNGVKPLLSPAEPEAAVPHRFAKLIGAVGTTLASGLILLGVPTAGYVVAVAIALVAGLAAVTGYCIGCRMYRQVTLFQRLSLV